MRFNNSVKQFKEHSGAQPIKENLEGAPSAYKPTDFVGNRHQLDRFLKEYYPEFRKSFIVLNPLTNKESDFFKAYSNEVLVDVLAKKGINWKAINTYLIILDNEGNKKWFEGTEEEYHSYKRKFGTEKEKEAYKIMDKLNQELQMKF